MKLTRVRVTREDREKGKLFARGMTGALLVVSFLSLALPAPAPPSVRLPAVLRVDQVSLSGLPVTVSQVESCDCWSGLRGQATRKVRMALYNGTSAPINIGGGVGSSLRLVVGYGEDRESLRVTLPAIPADPEVTYAGVPSNVPLSVADRFEEHWATRLDVAPLSFGLPPHYSLFLIPPNPHGVVEVMGEEITFPTYLSSDVLAPGEQFGNTMPRTVGVDTWTFYVPYPDSLASIASAPLGVSFKGQYDDAFVIVGIAIMASEADRQMVIGFAPYPSPGTLLSPMHF